MKSTFSVGCRSSRMSASCWPLICGMTMSVTSDVEGPHCLLDKVQRLGAAGGRHHLIPLPAQGVGGKVAHDELVFHQQHRLVALARPRSCRSRSARAAPSTASAHGM